MEDFNVWVWSVWAAWSMAALAQSHSTLNNKWWDRLQAPSLSHTLLLHQSTVVHIMDSRSKLNFYYFQMSTSKCVETCQFQSWIITHGPPDWELEKVNNGVRILKVFCIFFCIECFCFSLSLPVSQYGLFPSQTVCLLQITVILYAYPSACLAKLYEYGVMSPTLTLIYHFLSGCLTFCRPVYLYKHWCCTAAHLRSLSDYMSV